jgi:hypothetical protein
MGAVHVSRLQALLLALACLGGRSGTTPCSVCPVVVAVGPSSALRGRVPPQMQQMQVLRGGKGGGQQGRVPLSEAAKLNNDIVAQRDAADPQALCALVCQRHRDFNSVNFVTAFRAVVRRVSADPPAPAAFSPPSAGEGAPACTPALPHAWRANKTMGSELDRSARAALKEGRFEVAADLAHSAMLAFREAGRQGLQRAARMEKSCISLHNRALSLLRNSSNPQLNASAAERTGDAPPQASLDAAAAILAQGITLNIRDFDVRQCVALLHVLARRKRAAATSAPPSPSSPLSALVPVLLRRVAALVQQVRYVDVTQVCVCVVCV